MRIELFEAGLTVKKLGALLSVVHEHCKEYNTDFFENMKIEGLEDKNGYEFTYIGCTLEDDLVINIRLQCALNDKIGMFSYDLVSKELAQIVPCEFDSMKFVNSDIICFVKDNRSSTIVVGNEVMSTDVISASAFTLTDHICTIKVVKELDNDMVSVGLAVVSSTGSGMFAFVSSMNQLMITVMQIIESDEQLQNETANITLENLREYFSVVGQKSKDCFM